MKKKVEYIQLVDPPYSSVAERGYGTQPKLFDVGSKNLLIFMDMASTSETLFVTILKSGIVRVFDLRVAPRFDIGQLSRARVFQIFGSLRIDYFDIAGALAVPSRNDVRLNPERVAPAILPMIDRKKLLGPNLFLLEDGNRTTTFAELLPRSLQPAPKRGWETFIPYDRQSLTVVK